MFGPVELDRAWRRLCGVMLVASLAQGFETRTLCQLSSYDNANAKGNAFYIEHVPENWPVGTTLSHLSIRGTSADIALTTSDENDFLSFDPVSRNITVIKALHISRAGERILRMTLQCERLALSSTIMIPVIILLEDINDNPPIFEQFSYTASVSELASLGTPVISSIVAKDADPENWLVTYHLLPGEYSSYFSIPIPSRGEIVLKKALDYESVQKMYIDVIAKDNHLPVLGREQQQLSSSVRVVVSVRDEDDLNPIFTTAVFTASVLESDTAGRHLEVSPAISARDPDTSFNTTLHYTFVPDPVKGENSFFSIDALSGRVSLRRDALRRGALFSLLVKATQSDNADRYATSLLRVSVQAANENAPKFVRKHQVTSLLENAPIGSYVTTVSAIDNDEDKVYAMGKLISKYPNGEGAVLTYRFSSAEYETFFKIDSSSGAIETVSGLDFERRRQHNLSVEVTDGKHTDAMLLTVNIVDVNDNNPRFSEASYHFAAESRTGSVVGIVQVSDADSEPTFTFSFLENTTLFSVNRFGEIRLLAAADDITQSLYTLYVRVGDGGTSPRHAVTPVTVTFDLHLPVTAEQQMNSVAIIILGVLVGCLALIIGIMMIHLCKSNRKDPTTDIVRSGSFEGDLHLDGAGYKNYYDDGAEGLAYKPNQRHLSLYNGITLDAADSTALQQNPFSGDDGARFHDSITPRFMRHGAANSGYLTHGSESTTAASVPSVATRSDDDDSMVRRMAEDRDDDRDDLGVVPSDQMPSRGDVDGFPPRPLSSVCSSERSLIARAGPAAVNQAGGGVTSFAGGTFNRPNTTEPAASIVARAKVRPGITVYY